MSKGFTRWTPFATPPPLDTGGGFSPKKVIKGLGKGVFMGR